MQKKVDFWQCHSLHYLEMAFRNDRRGTIAYPDGYKTNHWCCDIRLRYLQFGKNTDTLNIS